MDEFFATAHQNMVKNQVMTSSVFDKRIWQVMSEVPRHKFCNGRWQQVAYLDRELPLGQGRFMLQPALFAQMLQALEISSEDKVLDIGCGNGYSTAVIAKMAGEVVAVESARSLALKAAELLPAMQYHNISIKHGELLAGAVENAPYDVIFINGLISRVPEGLFHQLRKGGRLVTLERYEGMSKAVLYRNISGIYSPVEKWDGYASSL